MLWGSVLCWVAGVAFASPYSQLPLVEHVPQAVAASQSDALVNESPLCPQARPLTPTEGGEMYDRMLYALHEDPAFQLRAFEALGKAIRVPTESYDDLAPVGEDPRWDTFAELHKVLEATFPKVYRTLQVTKVNTYGIVLHWQGSDPDRLPVLITAHQDVVPVEPSTAHQWIYPPFSGHYDGTWIWGRGSVDDKSDLISIHITIESLLRKGFKPTRTFVFAFGFDEEATSNQGAGHLSVHLEEKYGVDGFAALLDEGGGYGTLFGSDIIFATPSTAEKGYLDVRIAVSSPGGHSSVPPKHTGIGILAAAIVEVESNPNPTSLRRNGTAFEFLECAAEYGPGFPDKARKLVREAKTDNKALSQLQDLLVQLNPLYSALLGTTQAVDLIQGGVKVNALPERAEAVVNHRIAEHSSIGELQSHITNVLLPVATAFDLTFDAFGANITAGSGVGGHLALSDAWGTSIEPAPMTPVGTSGPWQLLSGTIKAALKESHLYGHSQVVVAPELALGNTDTRWYWNLTRHIFRYSHTADAGVYGGIHTVNEALSGEAFVDKLRFHAKFILNWDESDL